MNWHSFVRNRLITALSIPQVPRFRLSFSGSSPVCRFRVFRSDNILCQPGSLFLLRCLSFWRSGKRICSPERFAQIAIRPTEL